MSRYQKLAVASGIAAALTGIQAEAAAADPTSLALQGEAIPLNPGPVYVPVGEDVLGSWEEIQNYSGGATGSYLELSSTGETKLDLKRRVMLRHTSIQKAVHLKMAFLHPGP